MQEYNKTDEYIHQLSQSIAKFNRSYVPKKSDDSHTNLAFDSIGMRLFGRWVESKKGRVMMVLNLLAFDFQLIDDKWNILIRVSIEGKTQMEIERILQSFIADLGLKSEDYIKGLHFQITAYPFKNNVFPALSEKEKLEWTKNRAMANEACMLLLNHLQTNGEIRIWPHHFDTGIYVTPNKNIGLGFGLAMKDSLFEESYFYYSAYGLNDYDLDYTFYKPLKVGAWKIEENWKGAYLTLAEAEHYILQEFIQEVSNVYLGLEN
ncbi:hypothetical protein [Sediminitomix flava]|uniref:Uncharacterized protein n=1 Tax=Sediminitomix flava TaxID=379075 RepID=A0A315ZF06_SEDFL|nr:hypothetical protein [Sediminitomix flava]PWJ43739.1 hypothetical protein BC781_10185 [Sediminitomix flava]